MTARVADTSPRRLARFAGLLYLILAVCGGFAEFFVRQDLIAPGDAATTAKNILDSESLFRLGIVSELIGQTVFVLLVLALYRLLNRVNRNHAVVMVVLASIAIATTSINMLNQFGALLVLKGDAYLSAFNTEQLHALSLLFLELHDAGYAIAQVFFGLWLLPLGYLVYRSGFLPRILGVLLIVACFGYVVDVFTFFLFPSFDVVISEFTFVGELLLMLWLLAKGVSVERWNERAAERVA